MSATPSVAFFRTCIRLWILGFVLILGIILLLWHIPNCLKRWKALRVAALSGLFIDVVFAICVIILLYVRYRAYEAWRQSFSDDNVIGERWFDRFDNFWLRVDDFDRFCVLLPIRVQVYSPLLFRALWKYLAHRPGWTEVYFHQGGVIMVTIAEGIARVFKRLKRNITEETPLLSIQDPET